MFIFWSSEKGVIMKTPKYKHLTFEDRCTIQQYLNLGLNFTEISNRIGKDRRCISKEIQKHRFKKHRANTKDCECPLTAKPPYVCNSCDKAYRCTKLQYLYNASVANNAYQKTLRQERSHLKITEEEVAAINDVIAPLMIQKHHSVNHVYAAHPEVLPISKSTFYKYIDLGVLNVKNIDLQRKVRYKVKKEYDYTRPKTNVAIKIGRFYTDFQEYIELHPMASIVEMDTVIGTPGGKGGKCFLTLLFRAYNFMLIIVLPYKRSEYVTKAFLDLKNTLGDEEFHRLFEVILTDNGTEFSDPVSIEASFKTGEKLSSLFYCEPNCSWQKGCIEKNHEYIRYVLPKKTSFAGITQDDANLLASHINSVPRVSLNNRSPYEAALGFIGQDNINKLNIQLIPNDEIDLTMNLLRK